MRFYSPRQKLLRPDLINLTRDIPTLEPIRANLMADRSTVGRKCGSAFRRPEGGACSAHAGLSTQWGFGRNLFLYGEPVRPPFEPVGQTRRRAVRRGAAGPSPRAVSYRRLDRPSRPHALPVDL